MKTIKDYLFVYWFYFVYLFLDFTEKSYENFMTTLRINASGK